MSRKIVNSIRERVASQLNENALLYKRKLLREVDALWRQTGGTSTTLSVTEREERLNALAEKVANEFRITGAAKDLFIAEVKSGQAEIAQVWKSYFEGVVGTSSSLSVTGVQYEKLAAMTKMEFKGLQDDVKDIVVEETKKIIAQGQGIGVLRQNLNRRGMGANEAEVLANASMAGFDNASHVQYATAAGLTHFKYDGIVDSTTRPFCRQRVGKIYTIEELDAMENGQLNPVSVYLGGYRCKHFLTAQVPGLTD